MVLVPCAGLPGYWERCDRRASRPAAWCGMQGVGWGGAEEGHWESRELELQTLSVSPGFYTTSALSTEASSVNTVRDFSRTPRQGRRLHIKALPPSLGGA